VKASRRRRLNAAEAAADQASARQNQMEQLDQPEQREQHRRQLSRVHRRNSKSVVASQRDGPVRNQVPARVEQGKFRRRVTSKDLSVTGSARLRLPAQMNVNSAAEVHRLDFIGRPRLRLVADQQVKHAAREKERRAPMVSRRNSNNNNNNSSSGDNNSNSSNSSKEVARLPQPITASDRVSRKVGRRGNQKKRHRQGSNNFVAITTAAPERENSGAAFFITRRCRSI